jgi:hypothetical protein
VLLSRRWADLAVTADQDDLVYAELESVEQDPVGATPVSRAPLQADLANSQARDTRLVIQQLGIVCPSRWGNRSDASPASAPPADIEQLQRAITRPEQQVVNLTAAVEKREAELDGAREVNRQPARALNQRE